MRALYLFHVPLSYTSFQLQLRALRKVAIWLDCHDGVCRRSGLEVGKNFVRGRLVEAGVVGLHVSGLHLSILDNQSVTLGAVVAKNRRAIKGEV